MDAAGMVYLVGAGPGDPKLITVRGVEVLREADLVVYDRLVNPALLEYCRPEAEKRYAGKAPRQHSLTQAEINALLVEEAGKGRTVCRLKGGDPFLFGRGGEEAEALAAAGIPFQVVPGITAAVGAGAYAGIPLTHRGVASSVAFLTGSRRQGSEETATEAACGRNNAAPKRNGGIEQGTAARARHSSKRVWRGVVLARRAKNAPLVRRTRLRHEGEVAADTLVIYMGVGSLPETTERLLEGGRAPETPVAVVSQATTPRQKVLAGTLETIAQECTDQGVEPPAVVIVGEVVRLRDQLAWFGTK